MLTPSSTLRPSPTLLPGSTPTSGGGTPIGTGADGLPIIPQRALAAPGEWSAFARGDEYALSLALPIISARAVVKHMGLGKATLSTPYTNDAWDALAPSRGVAFLRSGRQVFTGPIQARTLSWGSDGMATISVDAVGDEVVLADRLAMPDPLREASDQTANDYWTATGRASTAMVQLINDQAGATCAASRRVTGLTVGVDPAQGVTATWTGLFDNVLNLLESMATASGVDLGLRVASAQGALTAKVVVPRDLTQSVIFSADLANVGDLKFTESAPTVTNALVAGQGDLHLRTRLPVASSDDGTVRWGRQVWDYVDRRDTNDTAKLTQAGADTLVKGQATVALSLVLRDTDAATYGADWDLGDRVTVYVGLPDQPKIAVVEDVVRELTFTVNADGTERIQPAIGSVGARTFLPTPAQRALTAVDQQVSALIKNK